MIELTEIIRQHDYFVSQAGSFDQGVRLSATFLLQEIIKLQNEISSLRSSIQNVVDNDIIYK